MYFRLKCECGKAVTVTEGAAGVSLSCACGRAVVVPEVTELRQRAAAGEIGCTLYADGEKPPPLPSPIANATYVVFGVLLLLAGGLIVVAGLLFAVRYGRIGIYTIGVGIFVMASAVVGILSRHDLRDARRAEQQEFARFTGRAHRSVGGPVTDQAKTAVSDRPPK
jgi:hypothetical protein